MARLLTLLEIPFAYESQSYLLDNGQHYRPDFVLDTGDVIEVRGYDTPDGTRQLAQFMREVGQRRDDRPKLFCCLFANQSVSGRFSCAGVTWQQTDIRDDLKEDVRIPMPSFEHYWGFRQLYGKWFPWGVNHLTPSMPIDTCRGELADAWRGPFIGVDADENGVVIVSHSRWLGQWRSIRDVASIADFSEGAE